MIAALAVWEGRMSPVFDVSREALVLTIKNGAVAASSIESIQTPTASLKVERLLDLGVETLICGAISEALSHDLTTRGVTVIGFVAGNIEEIVDSFLSGTLPTRELSMPGCGRDRNLSRPGPGRKARRGGSR